MRFVLEGFHILDSINSHLDITGNWFRVHVIVNKFKHQNDTEYFKTLRFEAIFYDTRNGEYQIFGKDEYTVEQDTIINPIIESFMGFLYINMVFTVETNTKDHYGKRIWTFRDILEFIRREDKLPKPVGRIDVNNIKQLKFSE